MTVFYEWDVEEIACEALTDNGMEFDAGDVMEHYHQTSFKDCKTLVNEIDGKNPINSRMQVVLVRDDDHGRLWAYMDKDGNLPEFFSNAWGKVDFCTKVPKRFHEEVKRNSK